MKWAYDLCGAEPIIRDTMAYDGALIDQGELVMLATGDYTVGHGSGVGVITAYNSTASKVHGIDVLGISLEKKTTADSPSIATVTDTTAESCYIKTIINPFAIYRAECVTSELCSITSWTTTHMVLAGIAADIDQSYWLYVAHSSGPNFGQLRFITEIGNNDTINTSANVTATASTADQLIFAAMPTACGMPLDQTAVGVTAISSGTTDLGLADSNFRCVEAWLDSDEGFEPLRQHKHYNKKALKGGNRPAKLYNDILCKDHAYGVQEA
jgi:hypothetical protein